MTPSSVEPDSAGAKFRFSGSTALFVGLLAATVAAGYFVAKTNPLASWVVTIALMAALIIAAGFNIKKLYFGFLIDRRNRYSLARLQTLVWTLVVLSAYLTAVFVNLHARAPDPLAIAVPEELWVLMGISVTSLLASPLLLNQKRSPEPEDAPAPQPRRATKKAAKKKTARKRATRQAIEPETTVDGKPAVVDGQVVEKLRAEDASWSDLFKGETSDNSDYLDISRVQLFYFTFILVVGYCYYLGQLFHGYAGGANLETPIESLPAISGGMLALLGISHTAYLGNKAIPPRKPADRTGQNES